MTRTCASDWQQQRQRASGRKLQWKSSRYLAALAASARVCCSCCTALRHGRCPGQGSQLGATAEGQGGCERGGRPRTHARTHSRTAPPRPLTSPPQALRERCQALLQRMRRSAAPPAGSRPTSAARQRTNASPAPRGARGAARPPTRPGSRSRGESRPSLPARSTSASRCVARAPRGTRWSLSQRGDPLPSRRRRAASPNGYMSAASDASRDTGWTSDASRASRASRASARSAASRASRASRASARSAASRHSTTRAGAPAPLPQKRPASARPPAAPRAARSPSPLQPRSARGASARGTSSRQATPESRARLGASVTASPSSAPSSASRRAGAARQRGDSGGSVRRRRRRAESSELSEGGAGEYASGHESERSGSSARRHAPR